MVAAMMLPASLPPIEAVEVATERDRLDPSPAAERAGFLGRVRGRLDGLRAGRLLRRRLLHHVVDATPWLAERPWLIEAGVLALAGGDQFAPIKRRSLAACRHPMATVSRHDT